MYRAQNKLVNPDPNHQFILDLHSWVSHLQQDGTQVILGIDNNDELNPSHGQIVPLQYCSDIPTTKQNHNSSLDTLVRSTGLIDILHHHHKSSTYPPTYMRGRKMIDLILVSASLLHAVTRSGILPYHSVFQGDHHPCYVDIDVSLAFDGKTSSISPPCQRTLQLHDPRIVAKYLSPTSTI